MNNHRLGYQRLAEALVERGLVEPQAVQDALSMGNHGGLPFPEALVTANLVADWELSHVVCQLYSLPFLTAEMAEPDPEAQQGLDIEFLFENGIVPLSRHGQVVALCLPANVAAEILGCISAESDLLVLVVVGTVNSNRRWIQNNTEQEEALASDTLELGAEGSEWGNLFDEADAAVLSDLDVELEVNDLTEISDLGDEEELIKSFEEESAPSAEESPASNTPLPPPLKRMSDAGADDETIL